MFAWDDYQLLDFGAGRKLERFGSVVLDRPAPAASEAAPCLDSQAWAAAAARYERTYSDEGHWILRDEVPDVWPLRWGPVTLELRLTDFGHLGVFPEHADNWRWLVDQVASAGSPLKVLNLFAYTGGATLALAAAGAQVVHVDSARASVAWARRNAERSGLTEAPIRWIVEDAAKFVSRELKRGNAYDAVLLDPPSYGHGPRGEVWKLVEHLPRLLQQCFELTKRRPRFMLLSCHTPGIERAELIKLLAAACSQQPTELNVMPMALATAGERQLACGMAARWMG
jgi:23S rRNA (cytosine1962-C5)-methyltransferase